MTILTGGCLRGLRGRRLQIDVANEMLSKNELFSIGRETLAEQGLRDWKVWYADSEAETLVDRQPAEDTAFNIRYCLTDAKTFLTIRLVVEGQSVADNAQAAIKSALIARLHKLGRV